MNILYEKIKKLRLTSGLKQSEMAQKLGITNAGYSKIERGEIELNIPRLEQLCEIFEISLQELLFGDTSLGSSASADVLDLKKRNKELERKNDELETTNRHLSSQIKILENSSKVLWGYVNSEKEKNSFYKDLFYKYEVLKADLPSKNELELENIYLKERIEYLSNLIDICLPLDEFRIRDIPSSDLVKLDNFGHILKEIMGNVFDKLKNPDTLKDVINTFGLDKLKDLNK